MSARLQGLLDLSQSALRREWWPRPVWQAVYRWADRKLGNRMSLHAALVVLSECHTRTDWRAGFVVEMYPTHTYFDPGRYAAAWRTIRLHLRQQTEPTEP